MIKFSDVRFRKGTQYNPYGRYADKYGNETFWVAEIKHEIICIEHTKAECTKKAREIIKRMNEEEKKNV